MKNVKSNIKIAALSIAGLAISAGAHAQCNGSSHRTVSWSASKQADTGITGLQGSFVSLGKHSSGSSMYGYHVSYVAPKSSAYSEGIKAGDILVTAGKHLISPKSWSYYKKQLAKEGSLKTSYLRNGKTYEAQLEIAVPKIEQLAPVFEIDAPVFVSAEVEAEIDVDEIEAELDEVEFETEEVDEIE